MKPKNTVAAFINTLLEAHEVSLEMIVACAKEHSDELDQMKDIYDLRSNGDVELLLTLPLVLISSEEAAVQVIDYFKSEEFENPLFQTAAPNLARHKVLLLSAFVYNPSFFSMAWNWCAYIQDKVRREQSKQGLSLVKSGGEKREFPFKKRERKVIERKVAASSGNLDFGDSTAIEGIGELRQLAEEIEGQLYFQFSLSVTNEQLLRPFVLEIEFSTLKDGKVHTVEIRDNPDEPEQVIRSEPRDDIDVSLGIEIHCDRIEFKPI